MKKIKLLLALSTAILMVSCTTVESGHKGVEVSWEAKQT